MTGIQPFHGDVLSPAHAYDVVSPAYDAMTVSQRRQFRLDYPHSYLNVTRSAEDEPDAATVDHATLVARGRASLEQIVELDLFTRHSPAAFYVYRLTDGDHYQDSLLCEAPSEYFASVAKPHEATQADRAALLAEHFLTVKAASSPVACAVRDDGQLEQALADAAVGDPIFDFVSLDGVRQTVWIVSDQDVHARLQERVDGQALFIIDGHHRCAANQQLLERGVSLPVLLAVFPEQSLHLVGFHRLLRLPERLLAEEFVLEIRRRFRVETHERAPELLPNQVALVIADTWYVVHFDERPMAGGASIRLGSLDPVVLEREILQGIVGRFGAVDVTYRPDTSEAYDIVHAAQSDGRIPIFVPPVDIGDMMAVAEGGLIMPAKSTYFTPKVRSGVFLRLFDDLI